LPGSRKPTFTLVLLSHKLILLQFQPISTAASPNFDMVLGMAFRKSIRRDGTGATTHVLPSVRNAYLLVNFGDFVDGKLNQTADPFVQLLATTNDTAEAHSDFVKVRGSSQSWNPSGGSLAARIRAHLPLVIGVAVGVAVLLLAAVAFCCLRNRKMRRTPAGFMNFQSSYQPLHEPAPPSYDMHTMGGGYGAPPQQHGNYNNPWDSHY
jgi:hypothetical protein